MATLKGELLRNDLHYSLEKTYLYDFVDILAWVEKYTRADEAFEGESPADMVIEEKKEAKPKSPPKNGQPFHSPSRCWRSRTPPQNPQQRDNSRRE